MTTIGKTATYPMSYVSIFYPAPRMEMGKGAKVMGTVPPKWGIPSDARHSSLIEKLNITSAFDGSYAGLGARSAVLSDTNVHGRARAPCTPTTSAAADSRRATCADSRHRHGRSVLLAPEHRLQGLRDDPVGGTTAASRQLSACREEDRTMSTTFKSLGLRDPSPTALLAQRGKHRRDGPRASSERPSRTCTPDGRPSTRATRAVRSSIVTTAGRHSGGHAGERRARRRSGALLEHGEKVECLDCIPERLEAPLRREHEDAGDRAWWLRRRIFGVFGQGEVYSQVIYDAQERHRSDARRALRGRGARGIPRRRRRRRRSRTRRSATGGNRARSASVRALERLNNEGPGRRAAAAMGDAASDVQLAALTASGARQRLLARGRGRGAPQRRAGTSVVERPTCSERCVRRTPWSASLRSAQRTRKRTRECGRRRWRRSAASATRVRTMPSRRRSRIPTRWCNR